MDDAAVLRRIHELVDEEHRLRGQLTSGAISSEDEQARLRELEESLDQCWDLLRRRRAARNSGDDPDRAQPRGKPEVEGYLQ
ncbi:Protein of unknown function [Micromonospora pattaloongensis]|uniref:DUF2630 domain-containing protein n=1 Tax=Micromonospora pattaloongensis TaxID=405436 RepID=A0A1H3QD83_9ACTN|nr:DUF2630 family protein [Micromonospora pattaloongensis]SDZ11223.1 Protein of unknown function [Micromonospora pattaloongensis]